MKKKEDHLGAKAELSRLESVICGGVSGLVARFVIAPLDVVKIRLQLDTSTRQYKTGTNVWRTMTNIARSEGVKALWKGNIPAEAMYVCYGAIQFTTYKQINHLCYKHTNLSENSIAFLSGAAAGAAATSLTYPLDLLRTRFAAQRTASAYKSITHAFATIYNTEGGVKGYFRGLTPAVYSIVPYMGLFFLSYEELRHTFNKTQRLSFMPAPDAAAGFIAGMVSKTIVFPFDLIRKRMQVQGPTRSKLGLSSHLHLPDFPTNIVQCIKHIVAREGIKGLYRGYFVSLIKNAPFTAVAVYTFERTLDVVRWGNKNGYIVT